jgi:arginase
MSEPKPRATLLGIPFDAHSSFLRGPALAPEQIREAMHSPSSNLSTEHGIDLGADRRWHDAGDVTIGSTASFLEDVEKAVGELLDRGTRVLSLGGDHSVTLPILRAYGKRHAGLEALHLDAHPDLYDELDGDRYSNGCPFARALEEGLLGRLTQVGIRTFNLHQRQQAERFSVRVIEARRFHPGLDLAIPGPVYVSIDLDVLDPAFAPGVSHLEPGGLSTREVLGILEALPGPIVGADVVELNPVRDLIGMTAMAGAKIVKELLARMLDEPPKAAGICGGPAVPIVSP